MGHHFLQLDTHGHWIVARFTTSHTWPVVEAVVDSTSHTNTCTFRFWAPCSSCKICSSSSMILLSLPGASLWSCFFVTMSCSLVSCRYRHAPTVCHLHLGPQKQRTKELHTRLVAPVQGLRSSGAMLSHNCFYSQMRLLATNATAHHRETSVLGPCVLCVVCCVLLPKPYTLNPRP